ncbi:MAG: hypothetical protein ACXWTY_08210 [Methylobacter sp.]
MGIREQQKTFPVTVLCKVMQVSTSAFYTWIQTPEETDKKARQKQLEAKAIQLFAENKQVYGLAVYLKPSQKKIFRSGVLKRDD